MLVRKLIWGNSYIVGVQELLGFKPFCHLLYLTLVWHMPEYADDDVTLIHHLEKAKNDYGLIPLTYLSMVRCLFIPRECQSIASRFFWGSRWGVCCFFMGLLCVSYSGFLAFSCFRRIFQRISYFAIHVYWFYFKKIKKKSSLVWPVSWF